MQPTLRLYEDVLANGAEASLPAQPRMIFVVHGSVAIADRNLGDGETFDQRSRGRAQGRNRRRDAVALRTGRGRHRRPRCAGPAWCRARNLPPGSKPCRRARCILRGDSVAFPPGGCAYLHRHQGPGIRCLLEGGIRIDTHGRSTSYGPGGAWYETGPDGVFAQAADRPTRFIRVMILPAAYLGKSSVEYLNEEDKAKPKSQSYKIFADMALR